MKKILLFAAATLLILSSCQRKETTVVTERFALDDMIYLTDEATDSLTVAIELEYPTQIYPDSICTSIQHDLKTHLFGEAYAAMEPQHAVEAYNAMLKTEYRNNNLPLLNDWLAALAEDAELRQEAEDGYAPIFCEEQFLAGTVMGIVGNILSYGIERYIYLGGPHGNNYRRFINYDLTTGAKLTEKEIFEENVEEQLTELLLKNMVKQNDEIDLIKDLELAGYNIDEIHPNDNFYLAEEGITYVFNPYDIAPYSLGETEILIPWEELKPLLRPFVLNEHRFSLKQLF